jgi:AraC-like DNA-binding protein
MFVYLLPSFGGDDASRLLDRAAAGRSAKQVAADVETFLVSRLATVGLADPRIAFLRQSAGDNCMPAGLRLDQLAAHVGLSERTLRRRCLDVFGYGDQAHMTREVRRMSGMTAGEFVAQAQGGLADSFKTAVAGLV